MENQKDETRQQTQEQRRKNGGANTGLENQGSGKNRLMAEEKGPSPCISSNLKRRWVRSHDVYVMHQSRRGSGRVHRKRKGGNSRSKKMRERNAPGGKEVSSIRNGQVEQEGKRRRAEIKICKEQAKYQEHRKRGSKEKMWRCEGKQHAGQRQWIQERAHSKETTSWLSLGSDRVAARVLTKGTGQTNVREKKCERQWGIPSVCEWLAKGGMANGERKNEQREPRAD